MWDHKGVLRRHRARLAATFAIPDAVFVIDDTTFPKQWNHSVGVQRQYCGALGKKANCQAAVSVHYVAPRGHHPLAMRLFLPASWVADAARLDRAGGPAEFRRGRTKGQIALDLLDRVRAEGLPGRVVLADAGYGVSAAFRRALHNLVGLTDEFVVFTAPPAWGRPTGRAGVGPTGGRPQTNRQLPAGPPRPVRLRELAARAPAGGWPGGPAGSPRCGSGRARVETRTMCRCRPGLGADRGDARRRGEVRPVQPAGRHHPPPGGRPVKAAVADRAGVPADVMEELGLDHFEGRNWRGFHHHHALVRLAYGFLLLERVSAERAAGRPAPRKGGRPSGR